ncbi:hypothetical protein BLA29_001916 [Euroglyphus maynei]|uniref:Uncharacterized protein n=1 Tax=Euroglyphus maynei TaxID=6958 RepID=A0A1Y3BTS0_EURMA|nr:hypothetical protein BLA29_001916 [Euroglyphus maynei]
MTKAGRSTVVDGEATPLYRATNGFTDDDCTDAVANGNDDDETFDTDEHGNDRSEAFETIEIEETVDDDVDGLATIGAVAVVGLDEAGTETDTEDGIG